MIDYVLDALTDGGVERIIVVVGYRSDDVKAALAARGGIEYAYQTQQLGTGHAVMSAQKILENNADHVMVLYGDHPLISPETIKKLISIYESNIKNDDEIKKKIFDEIDIGRSLLDLLEKSSLKNLTLTSVGIAIGASYFEQVTSEKIDIGIWIN